MTIKQRLANLAKKIKPEDQPEIIVCWCVGDKPPRPGVKVIYWDEEEEARAKAAYTTE